jgi:hypothetical protein
MSGTLLSVRRNRRAFRADLSSSGIVFAACSVCYAGYNLATTDNIFSLSPDDVRTASAAELVHAQTPPARARRSRRPL